MVADSVFDEIKHRSQGMFKLSHHDRSHVARVYNMAVRLAREENADLDVARAAALLHDIARAVEDEGQIVDHASEGARMSEKILAEVGFPREKVSEVVHCIEVHRYKKGMKADTLEAQILQDADRLDIVGAIGIARALARGGWSNLPIYDPEIPPKAKYDGESLTTVNHIYEKILNVKETMNTKTARTIAEQRHEFVEQFLDRLLKEWKGEM